MEASQGFKSWAIVELMGHRVRTGFAQEVEIAGGKMLRVDIPAEAGDITEYYGASSIYALRPCSEEMARAEAHRYGDVRPMRPIEYRDQPARPALPDRQFDMHDDDVFHVPL